MHYDFHVHTSRYSPCAMDPPETICRKAIEAGLAGIAITEHDLWWPTRELQDLADRFPQLALFRGVEYACPEGHFLAFIPNGENPGEGLDAANVVKLIAGVHERGGMVIWAHPLRFGETLEWLDEAQPDGIEVASTNINSHLGIIARKLALERGIAMFHNSDCHRADTLGRYYNEIAQPLRNTADLVRYLSTRCSPGFPGENTVRDP
jgi:predicted metal-dependent phosphoesterase TrpH